MPYNGDGMARRGQAVRGVDERLVMPGSGIEIVEGEVVSVPGADPPHATRHSKLSYVLEAHVARGFVAATDMLTRASERSDFAPDASVFPEGRDRETGGRRLEVLAFEVLATQRLALVTTKARVLSARGVRRIFALVLAKESALEWDRGAASPRGGRWRPMHRDETIEDESLATPLPIRALLDVSRADAAVLAAREARRPDLVDAIEARGRAAASADGRLLGLREAVESLCAARGVVLSAARRRRLRTADAAELVRVVEAIGRTGRWPPRR
jgi:hypothetical protein